MRIFIVGFMGAGKTTLGRRLAKEAGMPFFDLDEAIEEYTKQSITQWFAQAGEAAFRQKEHEVLMQLMEQEHFVMACGGGTPCFFDHMDRMNEAGITVYLQAYLPLIMERLATGWAQRPLLAMQDTEAREQAMIRLLQEREPFYLKSLRIIPAEEAAGLTFAEIIGPDV